METADRALLEGPRRAFTTAAAWRRRALAQRGCLLLAQPASGAAQQGGAQLVRLQVRKRAAVLPVRAVRDAGESRGGTRVGGGSTCCVCWQLVPRKSAVTLVPAPCSCHTARLFACSALCRLPTAHVPLRRCTPAACWGLSRLSPSMCRSCACGRPSTWVFTAGGGEGGGGGGGKSRGGCSQQRRGREAGVAWGHRVASTGRQAVRARAAALLLRALQRLRLCYACSALSLPPSPPPRAAHLCGHDRYQLLGAAQP